MSRVKRIIERVVEDSVEVERCDRCGTEHELETLDGFFRGPPKRWFVLFTPDDREQYAQGFAAGHSFCSIGCVERFAAERIAP